MRITMRKPASTDVLSARCLQQSITAFMHAPRLIIVSRLEYVQHGMRAMSVRKSYCRSLVALFVWLPKAIDTRPNVLHRSRD